MAGATATILFSGQAREVAASWKRVVASRAQVVEGHDFWVAPQAEGEGALGVSSRVVLRGTAEWEFEDEECDSVRNGLGFEPSFGISIAAFCRSIDSDRILGEVALALLESQEGALQFHGLLLPTLDLVEWNRFRQKPIAEQVASFPAAVGPHPGRVVAPTFAGEATCHVVDKAFLSFWLQHKAFHFVT